MSHVKPHLWADAIAGRLDEAKRAKLESHAATCTRCATARDRIAHAHETFPAVRAQPAPELAWDTIRARVHWSVSSERRASERMMAARSKRPLIMWAGLGLVASSAIAAGIALIASRGESTESPIATSGSAKPETTTATEPKRIDVGKTPALGAPALVGIVNRVGGDVMIDGLRGDVFEHRLVVGDVVATGDGHIDIQFGQDSALQLAPRSTLEIRRFDAQLVELVVDGTIDIEVGPRAADQRFLVHAGARDVEVRGTQFRVVHDQVTTTVACRHGVVAIRDGGAAGSGAPIAQVEVRNAQRVTVPNAKPVGETAAVPLSADELETLVAATPYTLPVWSDATALANASAPLDLAGARDVRVDGIEHGIAPMRVRVMPGRHTIEAADREGRFRRLGFVDTTPGTTSSFAIPALVAPPVTKDISKRREQLRTGIDRKRLSACVSKMLKQGLAPGSAEVEIAVDANGAIGVLNVDSDLGATTRGCIRDVLADVRFGAGVAATWREKIDL